MIEIQRQTEESQRLRWANWRQDETTKDFLAFLSSKINETAEDWILGRFNGNDLHSFVAQHAKAQGAIAVLQDIYNLTFDDVYKIEGEGNEGSNEQKRNTPNRGSSPYLPGRN